MEIPKGPSAKIDETLVKRIREQFPRLWGERRYLRSVMEHPEVVRRSVQYVILKAIRGQAHRKDAPVQPLIDLIADSVKKFDQILVLGEPGSGKTSTLYATAYRLCQKARYRQNVCWACLLVLLIVPLLFAYWIWQPNWGQLIKYPLAVSSLLILFVGLWLIEKVFQQWPIPVLLELRSYNGESVEEFLKKTLEQRFKGRAIAERLDSYIDKRRLVWLLDGVNEFRGCLYAVAIEEWRRSFQPGCSFARCPVVFTSRGGKEDPSAALGLRDKIVSALELDDDGVREFLRVYGSRNIPADWKILDEKGMLGEGGIGRNPYWLEMLVKGGFYTRNRGALFERFGRELIRRELSKPEGIRSKVPEEEELQCLGALALFMSEGERIGTTLSAANQRLDELFTGTKASWTKEDVLAEAQAATLMRISERQGSAEFSHQLVQEFFAAYGLRLTPDVALQHASDPSWWQTLLMLGGLVKNHSNFVESVLASGNDASRVLLSVALLRSVEEPDKELEPRIMRRLVESSRDGLTDDHKQATTELAKRMGNELTNLFGGLLEEEGLDSKKAAISLLGVVANNRSCELLIRALRDESVAKLASETLAHVGSLAIRSLTAAVYDDDQEICRCAFNVLRNIDEGIATKLLASLCDDLVHMHTETTEFVEDNRIELASRPPSVDFIYTHLNFCAAEILGNIGDGKTVEPLIGAMKNHPRDKNFCTAVVEGLGKIGTPAVEPLIAAMKSDPLDNYFCTAAIEALGRIGVPAAESLIRHWNKREWKTITTHGSVTPQYMGLPKRPLESKFTVDSDQTFSALLIRSLAQIADVRAIKVVTDACDDPDGTVRQVARDLLARSRRNNTNRTQPKA